MDFRIITCVARCVSVGCVCVCERVCACVYVRGGIITRDYVTTTEYVEIAQMIMTTCDYLARFVHWLGTSVQLGSLAG